MRKIISVWRKIKTLTILFRSSLEENKIFFEVFVSVLLGWMAINVSINANKIAEYQNFLTEKSYQPKFLVSVIDSNYNPVIKRFSESRIDIYNYEGYYENLDIKAISFLRMKFFNNSQIKELFLPVKNYYGIQFLQRPKLGLVRSITGYKNQERIQKIIEILEDRLNNNHYGPYFEQENYLAISYKDIIGKTITSYYDITSFESTLLRKEVGIQKFLRYDQMSSSEYIINIDTFDEEKERLLALIQKF